MGKKEKKRERGNELLSLLKVAPHTEDRLYICYAYFFYIILTLEVEATVRYFLLIAVLRVAFCFLSL